MLSDKHLARHCVEIHERYINNGDGGGGGHAGMSLNIYCGILGEKPERISALMDKAQHSDCPPRSAEDIQKYKAYYGSDPPTAGYYFRPST